MPNGDHKFRVVVELELMGGYTLPDVYEVMKYVDCAIEAGKSACSAPMCYSKQYVAMGEKL